MQLKIDQYKLCFVATKCKAHFSAKRTYYALACNYFQNLTLNFSYIFFNMIPSKELSQQITSDLSF